MDIIGLGAFLDPSTKHKDYLPGYGPSGKFSPGAFMVSKAYEPKYPGANHGGGVWGTIKKDVVKPLEYGAPIVLPYAAAAAVLALCPECVVAAGIAAGVATFGAQKEIAHKNTNAALLLAAYGHT